MVSVHMISYNHEKYISDAINGVIFQQTNFPVELIISDDSSTDNTRQIIESYYKQYPDKIRIINREKNMGAVANFADTFRYCTGKYIALCEGDDYWSDQYKLQNQIDFLENNPDYVGCFHNTEERYEKGNTSSFLYCKFPNAQDVSFKELAYGNFIPTCSAVFKNFNADKLPQWYTSLPLADWTLHLINSLRGNYWYIPKVMAVHRLHEQSIWMLQDLKRNETFTMNIYDTMIQSDTFTPDQIEWLKRGRTRIKNKYSLKGKAKQIIKKTINKLIPQ